MTRIAVIADSHFDEHSRFDECVRVHQWIADDIRERRVDLVLHSGDVFERKSSPRERAAVADWLRSVARFAPVVIVRGNHDAPGDLALFSKLRAQYPIIVEEAAAVHVVAGVAVACLAWPRKAELAARAPDLDPSDALRRVLLGLGQQLAEHSGPRVLLSHAMVRDSRVSTGQPLVGCDMELGVEDLALANADAYALGHIHMPQEWEAASQPTDRPWYEATAPVIYPGSPRRTAFGEVEEKGYVVLDFENHEPVRVTRITTPCARMLLVSATWEAGALRWDGEHQTPDLIGPLEGAEIRLRYTVRADERVAARDAAVRVEADWRARGAVNVKLEDVVVAMNAARAPEVAKARTLEEKLRALWAARGDVDEDRAARLLPRAHELEEAAS
ncbi:metallophosphoesterase family protein [Sandaracinus amylolyticus]|uniref:DNA double-strand break repair protein Mre11 n=1 Tax=Sandaracinus amylolyticus TaxID=927083 RepID=A0A0F6YKG4_9BACT|nr:metallophosphoesterase family protein [Sandaracinus amylolyticus]AKF08851.1 DNA double-strand break repair protein Mre11 [Sandaracinus amylolyticus]